MRFLAGGALAIVLSLSLMPANVRAENATGQETAPKVFKICKDQTYALCAAASCFVFNKLAYCACDVKSGDSISLPFKFGANQDVCSINAEGAHDGFMVSTFSAPPSVAKPNGDQALYNCPSGKAAGAYAQCDGGLCFTATEGQSFPGFDKPLSKGQVICSCPITQAKDNAKVGYQIIGPYPCQNDFFKYCESNTANAKNGSTVYVGAPAGAGTFLAHQLNGSVAPANQCPPPK